MARLQFSHILVAANVVLLAALATNGGVPRAATPDPDIIRARMIELVNERGEMRAQLYIGEDGGGGLRLRGGSGDIRVKLGATDDGAILLMMDGNADPTIRLASDTEPSLQLGRDGDETIIAPR